MDAQEVAAAYNLIFLALSHSRLGNREQAASYYALADRSLASCKSSLAPSDHEELSSFFKEAQDLGL